MGYFVVILGLNERAVSICPCFADIASRGKPWDDPNYHESPVLTGIYIVIGSILVLAIGGIWLYYKVVENKQSIIDFLGKGFVLLLVIGGVMLVGKCGESIHNATPTSNKPVFPQQTIPNNTPSKQYNSHQYQPIHTQHTPILKYRTVQYYENCFHCNGSGKVICPKCNGSGWIKKTCSRCGGKGSWQTRCFDCQGKGYTEDLTFGTGRHNCFMCNGTGYSSQNCSWCNGSGTESDICDVYALANHQMHYISCTHCNGTGKISSTNSLVELNF